MIDVNTVKVFMNGFGGGVVVGIVALPVIKYTLERVGGPVWQAVKKTAYNVWEDVKSLVNKIKFW